MRILPRAEQCHQFVVQVGVAGRNDVDHNQADAALQVGSTLGGKGAARILPILVPWANQFDCGYQRRTGHIAENLHLEIVWENSRKSGNRRGRRPNPRLYGGTTAVGIGFLRHAVFGESAYVYLNASTD